MLNPNSHRSQTLRDENIGWGQYDYRGFCWVSDTLNVFLLRRIKKDSILKSRSRALDQQCPTFWHPETPTPGVRLCGPPAPRVFRGEFLVSNLSNWLFQTQCQVFPDNFHADAFLPLPPKNPVWAPPKNLKWGPGSNQGYYRKDSV